MARPNRVTPFGELIADPARGLVYGNRGDLLDGAGRIRRHHRGRRWIACRLSFKGRRRAPLMAPGRYTELFFLDEATALAAGHRPCAECRREDYRRLVTVWEGLHPGRGAGAEAIDAQLHRERLADDGRARRRWTAPYASLPDGAFVVIDGSPWLVRGGSLRAWTPAHYGARRARPHHSTADVLTPPSLVALLRAGWDPVVPFLHPSASP